MLNALFYCRCRVLLVSMSESSDRKLISNGISKSNFAFIGIAIPIIGITLAISSLATVKLIPDKQEHQSSIDSIRGRAWLAIALSLVSCLVWWFGFTAYQNNKSANALENYANQLERAHLNEQ